MCSDQQIESVGSAETVAPLVLGVWGDVDSLGDSPCGEMKWMTRCLQCGRVPLLVLIAREQLSVPLDLERSTVAAQEQMPTCPTLTGMAYSVGS